MVLNGLISMVRARLHVICGNCGCNDEFTYEIMLNADIDDDGNDVPMVFINCRNCGTTHSLNTSMPERNDRE